MSILQPPPSLQDQRLVAVACLETSAVAQFEADRFLFLQQGHGILQPSPSLQDQRLVPVAPLQARAGRPIRGRSLLALSQGHGILQPSPILQDQRLVPVAPLQADFPLTVFRPAQSDSCSCAMRKAASNSPILRPSSQPQEPSCRPRPC